MTKLTLLCENTAGRPGVLGEHGLAWWIETERHRVLFDTGQGLALRHNAKSLGVDLRRADAVVLSHGHYDHVGGLQDVLADATAARLFFHPDAVTPKFSGRDGRSRRISTAFFESLEAGGPRVESQRDPVEVVPGVWTTGEIPRANDFEDTGGAFFQDSELQKPDPLLDDQALFFRTANGVVVVLGCAHAGVVNTLSHVRRLSGGAPFHAVLGGAHLLNASPPRMTRTLAALREFCPAMVAFNHCTGRLATCEILSEFGEHAIPAEAGMHWTFPAPN